MKSITSRANPIFKQLQALATHTSREKQDGFALLEGIHLTTAYLQQRGLPELVVLDEAAADHPEVNAVLNKIGQTGNTQTVILSHALYRSLSQVEQSIGLQFLIRIIKNPAQALSAYKELQFPHLQSTILMLDRIQDPGNLGSILRTAAAAGVKNIFLSSGTANAWSSKVLRAGMGAHFLLNIFEEVDLFELLAAHSNHQNASNDRLHCFPDFPILATSPHASISIYQTDLQKPCIWLFGHEGRGLADDLFKSATKLLSIPHSPAVESLNVAVAAAICLFEQMRQQHLDQKLDQ